MFVDRSVPRISREYERFAFAREIKEHLVAQVRECINAGVFQRRSAAGSRLPPADDGHSRRRRHAAVGAARARARTPTISPATCSTSPSPDCSPASPFDRIPLPFVRTTNAPPSRAGHRESSIQESCHESPRRSRSPDRHARRRRRRVRLQHRHRQVSRSIRRPSARRSRPHRSPPSSSRSRGSSARPAR